MQINTNELKNAITLLYNIAGKYSALVMTCLLTFKIRDNNLFLYSTDNANTLITKVDFIGNVEDKEISVGIEQIFKLVKTLTSEIVDIKINEKSINIKSGKSSYNLKAVLDSVGNLAIIKEPELFTQDEFKEIHIDEDIYTQLSLSMPADDFVDIYKNAYFGNCVLTTNSICASKAISIVFDNEVLLPEKIFKVLHNFNEMSIGNIMVILKSDKYTLYMPRNSQPIEDFHANELNTLFELSTEEIQIDFNEIKNALRRLSAFNTETIKLKFDNDLSIIIPDIAEEVIEANCNLFYEYDINYKIFKKYITKTGSGSILYGQDNCIQLKRDNILHVISATGMEDE